MPTSSTRWAESETPCQVPDDSGLGTALLVERTDSSAAEPPTTRRTAYQSLVQSKQVMESDREGSPHNGDSATCAQTGGWVRILA